MLGDRILVMSARPGRIKEVVDVDIVFARPRFVEQVKSSEQYGGLFGRCGASFATRSLLRSRRSAPQKRR